MDAEELAHCHTVARLLVNRLVSEISRRFGRLSPERTPPHQSAGSGQSSQHPHSAREWHEGEALTIERATNRI